MFYGAVVITAVDGHVVDGHVAAALVALSLADGGIVLTTTGGGHAVDAAGDADAGELAILSAADAGGIHAARGLNRAARDAESPQLLT